jgi:hypothetical protein
VTVSNRTAIPQEVEIRIYFDTLFFQIESILGYKCAQITTDGRGFSRFWAMESKEQAHDALNNFIQLDGVPSWLIIDNAIRNKAARPLPSIHNGRI